MTKTIDIKSMLIGFLLATSVMLFMGTTSGNGNGRYHMLNDGSLNQLKMIDASTGEIYYWKNSKNNKYWKKYTRDENWIVK